MKFGFKVRSVGEMAKKSPFTVEGFFKFSSAAMGNGPGGPKPEVYGFILLLILKMDK